MNREQAMNYESEVLRRQLLGVALVVGPLFAASLLFSPSTVLERLQGVANNPGTLAVAVALVYLLRPLVAWPVTPVSVLVGYGFGVTAGLPIALCGAVGTCLVPFLVGQRLPSDAGVLAWVSDSGERLFTATGDTRGILAARLIPIPTDVVSYTAGMAGVPARALVVGTALGELPWTVAAVLAGSSMQSFSVGGVRAIDIRLLAVAGLLAGLILAGPLWRSIRERR